MSKTAVKRPVVLVVEDDFLIRIDAVDMIEAAGFDVVEAANADEAMEILEVRLDITVVFTDIQMPGTIDGLKRRRRLGGAGRRSKLLRPPVSSMSEGLICLRAGDFCQNLTAPLK
jgi:CheY-like chemotaxis protein